MAERGNVVSEIPVSHRNRDVYTGARTYVRDYLFTIFFIQIEMPPNDVT